MSVRFLNDNSSNNTDVVAKTFPSVSPPTLTPWVRNPSWPPCEANSGDNRFRGLYAVWPSGANFIAMTVAGAYTVNYGDGTTTNYGSGVQANYEYNYNDADLVGTEAPVTFTDSTDTVNRTAHGYTNGMQVQFFNITTTTGIVNAQFYFVINATADTFQVSATSGGSALPLTNDGTGQLLPYRIATVTITPQAANNLTSINLQVKNSTAGLNAYSTGWLDLAVASSTITSFTIGAASLVVRQNILESIKLNQLGAFTNFSDFCRNLTTLQNIEIASSINMVTMSNMFWACTSLKTVPLFNINTASATNMLNMFNGCTSLQIVPLFNTASVTNMAGMFGSCVSLRTVPLFNTAANTNMQQMFDGCTNLQTVPLFNTVSVTNMQNAFRNCTNLKTVPAFNLVAATNMTGVFLNCTSLQTVPLFSIRTASAVSMTNMFQGCTTLQTVPLFNTVAVTSMSGMFSSCVSLQTVPLFNINTSVAVSMASMFLNCINLQTVPLFNTSFVTDMTSMFQGCTTLQTVPLFNTTNTIIMLSMFSGCTTLQTVPLFNTVSVTNMAGMFQNCSILQTVPLFNTIIVNNMLSMFSGCTALQSVPLFNTSVVTNMGGMFNGCSALAGVPALVTSGPAGSGSLASMFQLCPSLSRIEAKGFRFGFGVNGCKLSATALNEIYTNLPTVATSQTLAITGNYGVDTAITKAVTTTAQSVTVPMADTSGMVVGQFVTGANTGITIGISVASDVTADTFTLTNHGLTDGKRVSFSTLGTTTGISAWTIYFVVGATANTFQVALTAGGAAIDLTGTNATLNARYPSVITAINPGVSVTLDTPAATSGATTLTFRLLNSSTALLKNWTLSF
jgi:surface protein